MDETSRWQRLATPLGLFVFAFLVRCIPWPIVLGPQQTYFFGSDPYYHMRRIVYSLTHYPSALGFDPYLNHPEGGRAIWPPLFDLFVATLLLPVHALGDGLPAVERAAVFVPPLVGASTVVALYFLALRIFDRRVASVSGLVLCVLSGHFWYSQLGFIDHHAAVALAAVLLLGAGVRVVQPDATGADAPIPELGFGICVAGTLLLWPGAVLYLAIVEAGLLVHWLTRADRETAARIAGYRAWSYAFACAFLLPLAFTQTWTAWSSYSPSVLSRFQPWMLASLSLHALACHLLWNRANFGSGSSQRLRALQVAGIAVAMLVVSLVVMPDLAGSLAEAWRWFARREAFQSVVSESAPLLTRQGKFTTDIAELRLSRFFYLLPLALAAMCFEARSCATRNARWLFGWWLAVLIAATLQQKRFYDTSSVAVALLFGWAAVRVWSALCLRLPPRPWARWAGGAAVALGCLGLLAPTFAAYDRPLTIARELLSGEPMRLGTRMLAKRALWRTAAWIEANTPPTAGFERADTTPEYGLLGNWDLGHVLVYVGKRPTVVGNFGDDLGEKNFVLHRNYFRSDEPQATRLLRKLRARYVVVETIPEENRARLGPRTMLRRLTAATPTNLDHHRLIYESPPAPQTGRFTPGYRVFELVRGAVIEGQARPGARIAVRARLALPEGLARDIGYEVIVDEDGAYRVRLSHPHPQWRIEADDGSQAVIAVSESDVQGGATLEAPALLAASAEPTSRHQVEEPDS